MTADTPLQHAATTQPGHEFLEPLGTAAPRIDTMLVR
jgi:hypothetical protein